MLKKSKEYMDKVGASFLVTGEVLGERPMSQRKDALNIIERDAGVRGILLRPLSAKLLNPTQPEIEGIVDREKLLDISGRSRKPQMELAAKFGIKEYPNAAGGCLLTDPGFTKRVKDLIRHDSLNIDDLKLLKAGRHFRLDERTKLVVGRDEKDNEALESLISANDIIFKLRDRQGPLSILRGKHNSRIIEEAASIVAYHTKFKNEKAIRVDYWPRGSSAVATVDVEPAGKDIVENIRI